MNWPIKKHYTSGTFKIKKSISFSAFLMTVWLANSATPFYSPWRVIILGKSLGTIIESNLVYDLAAPSRIAYTRWIKTGASSRSWWGDHGSS